MIKGPALILSVLLFYSNVMDGMFAGPLACLILLSLIVQIRLRLQSGHISTDLANTPIV